MESKSEAQKVKKSENQTVIFSCETDAKKACLRLGKEGASNKSDKEVWLLRESSVPGLLTITYFNNEKGKYIHKRLGFVGGEWKFGPNDYHEAVEFSKRAEAAFSKALPPKSYESLIKILTEHGFDVSKQIIPKPDEATQHSQYTNYTDDAFIQSSTSTNRYTNF
ncbi:TPA: hypothetical protein ACT96X_000470 [Legionella pneumophila]|uniref:hypothetical protein n=1 Tax=Legionella pneumophila TaxID=446 RepID=UPI00078853C5|nr:hypothetical protein [Legionella pneumophila]HAU1190599.1 hypothetical protein [Legionella pneumophila]HBD7101076.1 hypothetical protein [Legionella pneumophila]HCO4737303.1 hypothetical protein [Legionella pneumophila]HDU7928286.1 hypothetical protein [Legionella pneumophila]HDU7934417.1 hypothetical protein [Legionella pneumophila]